MLWRGHALADRVRVVLLQIVLFKQGTEHVLVVLDRGAAAASVTVGVAVGFQLLIPILLPHPGLLPLQLHLLIPLLLNHIIGPLIQAHAPLLRFHLVLDQAGQPLWVRP